MSYHVGKERITGNIEWYSKTLQYKLTVVNEPQHKKTCLPEFATRFDSTGLLCFSLDILDIARIDIILSKQQQTKTLIRLRGCEHKTGFLIMWLKLGVSIS